MISAWWSWVKHVVSNLLPPEWLVSLATMFSPPPITATWDTHDQAGRDSKVLPQRPVRVGVIPTALEGAGLRAFQFLLFELNHLQSHIEYEILPADGHTFLEPHRTRSRLHRPTVRAEIPRFLSEYSATIRAHAGSFQGLHDPVPAGVILLSNARFDDNFYGTRTGMLQIIALGNWQRHMAPPSIIEFFLFLSLRYSLGFLHPSLFPSFHYGTKGCLWDQTPFLEDARFKVLNGFVCNSCGARLTAAGLDDLLPNLRWILRKQWLGKREDPASPASISEKLGYNLFVATGLKPTLRESILAALRSDAPKEILKVIGGLVLAGLLLWLGLREH